MEISEEGERNLVFISSVKQRIALGQPELSFCFLLSHSVHFLVFKQVEVDLFVF
jgi:hypothetical protein